MLGLHRNRIVHNVSRLTSWQRSLSTSTAFSQEVPGEPVVAGRGPARASRTLTPYEPHMTLFTNLLDRAKVDDGSRRMFGSRPVDPITGVATGDYQWTTFVEFLDHVDETAAGMTRALQLQRQDKVGIFSRNRYEWTLVEQSCNRMAYTVVPLYDTLGSSTVPYILNHTEMRVVFCAKDKTQTLLHCLAQCPHLKAIVQYESDVNEEQASLAQAHGVKIWTLDEVVAEGKNHPAIADPPKPDDLSSVCYTSGTTGTPKGVLITHANFVSAVNGYRAVIRANRDDIYLSYLPLPHVAERFMQGIMITEGAAVGFYHGNMTRVLDDMHSLHPSVFGTVPRLLNHIFDLLKHKAASSGDVELFNRAFEEKKRLNVLRHDEYDAAVFDQLKATLGGNLRQIVTGAAPITSEVKEFFQYVFGVPVLEAYGTTEV